MIRTAAIELVNKADVAIAARTVAQIVLVLTVNAPSASTPRGKKRRGKPSPRQRSLDCQTLPQMILCLTVRKKPNRVILSPRRVARSARHLRKTRRRAKESQRKSLAPNQGKRMLLTAVEGRLVSLCNSTAAFSFVRSSDVLAFPSLFPISTSNEKLFSLRYFSWRTRSMEIAC